MNSKIVFIIPYFGRFHHYFQLWLHSCKFNPTIDWLLITDDKTAYNYPPNVHIIYTTFEDVVRQIQEKFDFPIALPNPYLLCEFRVAYGEIFSDYIKDYDFWGYCDTDVIWGNLREHLTEKILINYTKISWRGHLTLFRNNDIINGLYKMKIDGLWFYKDALSNQTGFPTASDERHINYIFEAAGEKIYKELLFADLKIQSFNFSLLHFDAAVDYKNEHQLFLWDKGNLYRLYCENGTIYKENFAYVHFLKRSMAIDRHFVFADRFLIIPNKFVSSFKVIDHKLVLAYSRQRFYFSYLFSRLSLKYVFSKINFYYSWHIFKKKYPSLPLRGYHNLLPDQIKKEIFISKSPAN